MTTWSALRRVLTLVLMAWGGLAQPVAAMTAGSASPLPTTVLVSLDDPSLPAGCRPAQLAGVLSRFVDAFNRGDGAALARAFAFGPDFFYALGAIPPGQSAPRFMTRERAPLLASLAQRQAGGERLRLLMVQASDTDERTPGRPAVVIDWVLQRDGIAPAPVSEEGEARIDCRTQQIAEWHTAHDVAVWWPCPVPAGWAPGRGAPVACARRAFVLTTPAERAAAPALPAPMPFPLTEAGVRAAMANWIAAYNARDAATFLAYLSDDPPAWGGYSDCDYAARRAFVALGGQADVRKWIEERWRVDGDRLALRDVLFEPGVGPDGPVNVVALAVQRINRQLPNGRDLGIKVVFTPVGNGLGLIGVAAVDGIDSCGSGPLPWER